MKNTKQKKKLINQIVIMYQPLKFVMIKLLSEIVIKNMNNQ